MIHPKYIDIKCGNITFQQFIDLNKKDFSKHIIKENMLTFFVRDIKKAIPSARFLFIVRDPRSNIRSILNRLNLPGNLQHLDKNRLRLTPSQRLVLDNTWLGIRKTHYIRELAQRWNLTTNIYLDFKEEMILIRYEDFLREKTKTIEAIAEELGLCKKNDISDIVDIQYQPRGDHSTPIEIFFGEENLNIIEQTCHENMKLLQYC